jgi:hypothetical protein
VELEGAGCVNFIDAGEKRGVDRRTDAARRHSRCKRAAGRRGCR